MNILQICNKVPFPPKDGGCIAMNNLTQGLIAEGNQVKVMAINTEKHFIDIEKLPLIYTSKTRVEAIFIDTKIKVMAAFLNLFSNRSYNIDRFYSINFENRLIEILKSEVFDIVHLESLYVSMYVDTIRKYSSAKIILRAHNVEYRLWEHAAQLTKNPFKKTYLKFLARRLKLYELASLQRYDAIAGITKKDGIHFKRAGFLKAIETIPFGIDFKNNIEINPEQAEYLSVFHIGAMDWQPNIIGINWFLDEVWDLVRLKHPQLKLYLAGRNMSEELKKLKKPNVIIMGEVENSQAFIQSKGIMIVPLLSGEGMRVKIIEGLALGKTIVTTTIGLEGIDGENNKNCIIADDAIAFAEAISKCISDKIFYDEIGKNARILAAQHYNNADICKRLVQFYQKVVSNNN